MYLNDKNNNNLYLIELNKEGYYLKCLTLNMIMRISYQLMNDIIL